MRCATYSRKSSVDARRPGKSVADQMREARAEAERRGWKIIQELKDDGISASRHAKVKQRPGFEELVRLIETASIDAVIMAEQSRATRSLAVLGTLLELCADTGTVLVVGGTEIDPSRPEGFLMAGINGVVDASESERGRRRTLRAMRGAALAGRPAGKPLYGYRRIYDGTSGALERVDIVPEQAQVVREIVDRLLHGESVRAVTLDLNDRGIPTATGKAWHPVTVRRTAMNPAYAGLRVHRGEVVGEAMWEPIIPVEQHRALVARMTDPERSKHRPGGQRYLLSGTARCGECGGPLRIIKDKHHGSKRYACMVRGCMRVSVARDALEEYVKEAVIERLSRADVMDAVRTAGDDGADEYREASLELAALQGRRREIGLALSNGLDIVAAQVALEALDADIKRAEQRVRDAVGDPLLAESTGPSARARWLTLTDEQRNALVRLVVGVTVNRVGRGARRFDPDRVSLEWRI